MNACTGQKMRRLPRRFYERDTLTVARELIGKHLRREDVIARITEVEAYCGPQDTACHSRAGLTPRNAPMWGPAGRAYVYLCYGLHHMLNIVTEREGFGAAVLIRACEVDGTSYDAWSTSTSSPSQRVTLGPYAIDGTTLRVLFHYVGANDGFWAIDNIAIEGH